MPARDFGTTTKRALATLVVASSLALAVGLVACSGGAAGGPSGAAGHPNGGSNASGGGSASVSGGTVGTGGATSGSLGGSAGTGGGVAVGGSGGSSAGGGTGGTAGAASATGGAGGTTAGTGGDRGSAGAGATGSGGAGGGPPVIDLFNGKDLTGWKLRNAKASLVNRKLGKWRLFMLSDKTMTGSLLMVLKALLVPLQILLQSGLNSFHFSIGWQENSSESRHRSDRLRRRN